MRSLLTIYNFIFLLVANFLFSNIHFLDVHKHSHDHENNKCQECIIIENNNNYLSGFQEVNFSNNNINLFVCKYFSLIKLNLDETYSSRAPPIS